MMWQQVRQQVAGDLLFLKRKYNRFLPQTNKQKHSCDPPVHPRKTPLDNGPLEHYVAAYVPSTSVWQEAWGEGITWVVPGAKTGINAPCGKAF